MAYAPAPLALDQAKPPPWNAEAAFVSPEWAWAWRGLKVALPLWKSDGGPFELINRVLFDEVGIDIAWVGTRFGLAPSFPGSTGGGSYQTTAIPASRLPSTAITLIALSRYDIGNADNWGGIAGCVFDDGSGNSWILQRALSSSSLNFRIKVNNSDRETSGGIQDDTWAWYVGDWKSGSSARLRIFDVNGALLESASTAAFSGLITYSTPELIIGREISGLEMAGEVAVVLVYDRRLLDAEIRRLIRDPFGPFRLNWDYLTAEGGQTFTISPVGALSFAGDPTNRVLTVLAGSLSFVGALSSVTRAIFAGNLSFAGTVTRMFGRTVLGALTWAGTLSRRIRITKGGVLTPGGALVRKTAKTLTGTLTTAGAAAINFIFRYIEGSVGRSTGTEGSVGRSTGTEGRST